MVSALDSGASAPVSSPGWGHCVVFLGKTLHSHSASLHFSFFFLPVRPHSSVGRVTVDLIRGRGLDSHRGQKIYSLPRVVP